MDISADANLTLAVTKNVRERRKAKKSRAAFDSQNSGGEINGTKKTSLQERRKNGWASQTEASVG